MVASDFLIRVEFNDGTQVSLGGEGELFIEQTDKESKSCTLNDQRLRLINLLQEAEKAATD